jgi:hypothetical protein
VRKQPVLEAGRDCDGVCGGLEHLTAHAPKRKAPVPISQSTSEHGAGEAPSTYQFGTELESRFAVGEERLHTVLELIRAKRTQEQVLVLRSRCMRLIRIHPEEGASA